MDLSAIKKATSFANKTVRGGSKGKPSISVISAGKNGKRVTLSDGLITEIGATDCVFVGVLPDKRQLVISGTANQNLEEFSLRSGRYVYNSSLVSGIINTFGLSAYFTNHTSASFADMEFEDGMAIVSIPSLDSEAGEDGA